MEGLEVKKKGRPKKKGQRINVPVAVRAWTLSKLKSMGCKTYDAAITDLIVYREKNEKKVKANDSIQHEDIHNSDGSQSKN